MTRSATLDRVSVATVYLLYADDGATLVYAGEDADTCDQHRAALEAEYAGSLIGRRAVGPTEQWVVRSYFRTEPPPTFIAQRRGNFRFHLAWEPSAAGDRAEQ
ncbi:MAG: hypothetical protein HYX51_08500 [Chloroflexi bacterium]|nr:hypothetical protein [Chloroflexota bacterium]